MASSRKSKRKQDAIKNNAGIVAWRMAAAEYLRRGSFVHLPKRGTDEHLLMKERQRELIPIARQQIRKRKEAELTVIRIARAIRIAKRQEAMRASNPPPTPTMTPPPTVDDATSDMTTDSADDHVSDAPSCSSHSSGDWATDDDDDDLDSGSDSDWLS